jgi:hypothetical protein
MSSRRIACLLLGLWLGAGLLMAWVATQDLQSADKMAAHPDLAAAVQLKSLGASQALPLLRYLAAEQTRTNLETWGTIQLAIGSFFFFFMLFGTNQGKLALAIALLMTLIAFGQRLFVIPEILTRGRALDFVAQAPHRQQIQLNVLHYAYSLTEVVKGGLGLILAGIMVWRTGERTSVNTRQQVNAVDKADYRHVNR